MRGVPGFVNFPVENPGKNRPLLRRRAFGGQCHGMGEWLRLLLRLGFGAFFIWSGMAKLKDPIEFADAVRNFELVRDPVAPGLALLIPWVEVIAGVFTMAGAVAWRGGAVVLVGSLAVFNLALGIAWARGLDISCGCFGGDGPVNYPLRLTSNFGLMALGLWLLCGRRAGREAGMPPQHAG